MLWKQDRIFRKFYNSLREEKDGKSSYEISIGYAIHLHKAGKYEEAFIENKRLAEYGLKIGDLDVAERSYKRAIDDAERLGHIHDRMTCIYDMTQSVYFTWGRYDEAYKNYKDVLNYFHSIGDNGGQVLVLRNTALIHQMKGQYDEALKLLNESIVISRQLGDRNILAQNLQVAGSIYQRRNGHLQILLVVVVSAIIIIAMMV